MNIWYLSAYDQPRGRSSRTYDFALELLRRGHRVTFLTNSYCHWTNEERLDPDESWRVEEIDGIRVVWLRTLHYGGSKWTRGINMLTNVYRALQAAKRLDDTPDVVVGPSVPMGTGWVASRIARKRDAAFVFEVRDVWPISLVYDGGLHRHSPVYYLFRAIEKQMYRRAARISATMPFLADHVESSGSDPEKVVWIPNGINLERFRGLPPYDGGSESRIRVMYVGGFGVAHDVITIVRAANLLPSDLYRFVIVGDGPKRPSCIAEAEALGLENVEFRDPVPKAQIATLQTEADVLVASVTDSEAYQFGLNLNKIVDYFASGCPVVFSGNAPNDPIQETGAGYSVPPEDPEAMAGAFARLLEMDPEDRKRMGARGREHIERRFDMRKLGARMEQVLYEACGKRKRVHGARARAQARVTSSSSSSSSSS